MIHTSLRRFTESLGQSTLSLIFNLGGLFAGLLLTLYFHLFYRAPWIIALYPGILSVRGAIGGLFCGHLSTALHLGTIKASYTENTRHFYLLYHSIVVLAFVSGVVIGVAGSLFGVLLWGANLLDVISMFAVITSTMGISLILMPPMTMGVAFPSFRRGLDPDIVVYPIVSTLADILVTICYISSLIIFFTLTPLTWIIDSVFLIVVLYILIRDLGEASFTQTIKEFLIALLMIAFIINITGSILGRISRVIGGRLDVYLIYPALIDTIGDVGSIVGSTLTTKLFLGVVESSFASVKQHLHEIGGAWIASLMMFILYSLISSLIYGTTAINGLLRLMQQVLTVNILSVSVMIAIVYAIAILTYKRGWDPDNFVIPVESTLADTITTTSLLIALLIFT